MAQIFGGIADAINALAPGKTKQNWLSDVLKGQTDLTTAGLEGFRAGQAADLDKILAGIAGAKGQLSQIGAKGVSDLSQIIDQAKNATAFDLAQMLGNYQTGLLDKVAGNIANLGKAQDNRLLAYTGQGGRGGSTFQTNTILDRVSRNLSPAYASIIAGLPAGASSLIGGDAQRAATAANLINAQTGLPLLGVQADILGNQVRSQNLSDQIAALTGLGGAYNTNYLGTTYTPSKIGGVASGLAKTGDSIVDTGLSLYGMGAFNGLMGQKPTTPAAPTPAAPSGFNLGLYTQPYNYPVSPYGAPAPTGGFNVAATFPGGTGFNFGPSNFYQPLQSPYKF